MCIVYSSPLCHKLGIAPSIKSKVSLAADHLLLVIWYTLSVIIHHTPVLQYCDLYVYSHGSRVVVLWSRKESHTRHCEVHMSSFMISRNERIVDLCDTHKSHNGHKCYYLQVTYPSRKLDNESQPFHYEIAISCFLASVDQLSNTVTILQQL